MHYSKTEKLLATEKASEVFAQKLASCLKPRLTISFSGEIGAGKTTLIRAMLRELGVQSAIKSPSFSLVESYKLPELDIHHFDLYRIQDEQELEYIGFRDYFSAESLCCIEWPERLQSLPVAIDLNLHLSIAGAGRKLKIKAFSSAGQEMMTLLADETI